MMIIRFKIITLFCLFSIGQNFGQTYSVCHIYTINSQNNRFFLQTIPFDNIEPTPTGKTIVFDSDSTMFYGIPRHFEMRTNRKEIFLSNDGKTIAYVIDREFEWDGVENKSVEIFKNGISCKQYQLTDLINCDSDYEDCYLFYKEAIDTITGGKIIYKEKATDFEKELTKKATFLNNDSLYIFAKTGKLIIVDLNTANIDILSITNVNEEWFKQIKPFEIKSEQFEPIYGLPNLSNGESFENELAKYLDMVVFPDYGINSNEYRRYSLRIGILVDRKGNAILDKTDHHSGGSEILNDKIKTFVESQKFETNSIPNQTEMWRFSGWVKFMNKSKEEAKKEREQEILEEREAYKKRIVADTIDGFYIPQNFEECFVELNKILKPKDIQSIKNLKDKNKTILYHLGLGMWIRNKWGLWGGSRLQQYLIKKGIEHPDSMSGVILGFFYDWLNGQHDEWRKIEDK